MMLWLNFYTEFKYRFPIILKNLLWLRFKKAYIGFISHCPTSLDKQTNKQTKENKFFGSLMCQEIAQVW